MNPGSSAISALSGYLPLLPMLSSPWNCSAALPSSSAFTRPGGESQESWQ
jgi:hypothetical protein